MKSILPRVKACLTILGKMEGRCERTWVALSSAHQCSQISSVFWTQKITFPTASAAREAMWAAPVTCSGDGPRPSPSGVLGAWPLTLNPLSLFWWALLLPIEKVLLLEGAAWPPYSKASSDSTGLQAVVPNLSPTWDQFCERQFLHRTGQRGWSGDDSSTLYLLCTLFLSVLLLLLAPFQIIRR